VILGSCEEITRLENHTSHERAGQKPLDVRRSLTAELDVHLDGRELAAVLSLAPLAELDVRRVLSLRTPNRCLIRA
jgi:hypothetical protein